MSDFWKDKPEELMVILKSLVDGDGNIKHPAEVCGMIESYADEFAKKFSNWASKNAILVHYNQWDMEGRWLTTDDLLTEFKNSLK